MVGKYRNKNGITLRSIVGEPQFKVNAFAFGMQWNFTPKLEKQKFRNINDKLRINLRKSQISFSTQNILELKSNSQSSYT